MPSEEPECTSCPTEPVRPERFPPGEPLEAAIARHKVGELRLEAGASLLLDGATSPHLYRLERGVAFRHKSLADGRRQILNFAFPGDLVGVQGAMLGAIQHSVDALSAVDFAVFDRACLQRLFASAPAAAFQVAWRAARDECILDETLLSLGRRSARESAAWLLALLHQRAEATGLAPGGRLAFPLTQQHVADTLGLSAVHTNRILKRLADDRLIAWRDRGCVVRDPAGLLELAGWAGLGP